MDPSSPYSGIPPSHWLNRTRELIEAHPLKTDEIVEVVFASWNSIFNSIIGTKGFSIGTHIFPKPQIMGFLLHELIPLEFEVRHPGMWRGDKASEDKDLVYIPDGRFSVEIKTSSHTRQIFGNRSYAQKTEIFKKNKSGYLLAINFEKFSSTVVNPQIRLIRFGWLDHGDWIGQTAATGQQARLAPNIEQAKLLILFPSK